MADSVNHLLVVGFYRINVGYVAFALRTRAKENAARPPFPPDMRYLTVIYDPDCGLCSRIGTWLLAQPKLLGLLHWAQRLSRPALAPFAGQAFTVLSANRQLVSKWLGLLSDGELEAELHNIHMPKCYGTDPQIAP